MKTLLSSGLLTACAMAMTARQADAWVNAKFSVGLNWQWQSANNSVLWGLWRNGHVPGCEAFCDGPFQYGAPQAFPWFGNAQPNMAPAYAAQTAPPQSAQQSQAHYQNAAYQYNPYQAVSYQPNAGYQAPAYNPSYYPNYGYQVPSYWYQGR